MGIVSALIDKTRARTGITSDSALAAHFGVHRQAVSKWRNEDAYPDEEHIVAMSIMAGEDPGQWLVAVKAVRTSGPAKKAWETIMKRLAATAALLLILIVPTVQETAYAREQIVQETHRPVNLNENAEYTLCEITILLGLVRLWLGSRLSAGEQPPLRWRTNHSIAANNRPLIVDRHTKCHRLELSSHKTPPIHRICHRTMTVAGSEGLIFELGMSGAEEIILRTIALSSLGNANKLPLP